MEKKYLKPISVIQIEQPIGVFYIGVINSSDLLKVANKNLSRYKDVENGLQRERSPQQMRSIQNYLALENATLPNSIIVNIGYDDNGEPGWLYNENTKEIIIEDTSDSVNVIDGQHRLFSLDGKQDFQLPVSIFLGLPLAEQGIIFSTINGNQRSVDSSLVYELFGMSKRRIVETVAYKIVSALNDDTKSPWYKRIKMLGKAKNDGDISQGAFSKYIHKNLLSEGKVMRKLYENQDDDVIYKILLDYYQAIQEVFPKEWMSGTQLTKTTGFYGFMQFFIDIAKLTQYNSKEVSKEYFREFIARVKNEFGEFTNNEYPAGAIGQNKIRDILRSGFTNEEKSILGIK